MSHLFVALALEANTRFAGPRSCAHVASPAAGARKLAFSASKVGRSILFPARLVRWDRHSGPRKFNKQKTNASDTAPCPVILRMDGRSKHGETSSSPGAARDRPQVGAVAAADAWSLSFSGCVPVTTN